MAAALGVVRTGQSRVQDATVELFAVPADFQRKLPIGDRRDLAELPIKRLGSALSGRDGGFRIEYPHPAETAADRAPAPIHLWLVVSIYNAKRKLVLAHQEREVRVNAGLLESFLAPIDEALKSLDASSSPTDGDAPARVTKSRRARRDLSAALVKDAKASGAERAARRKTFRTKVLPALVKQASTVERDRAGKPRDPNYVDRDGKIREHAEARLKASLVSRFQPDSADALVMPGRVSLTDAQRAALVAGRAVDPLTNSVTVTDQELDEVIRANDGAGLSPVLGAASISRTEVIQAYCRPKSLAERCLAGEEVDHDHGGEPGPGGPAGPAPAPPPAGPAAEPPTAAQLTAAIPGYIAGVLDQRSALDVGFPGPRPPGTQLTEADIAASSAFPSLTLPAGPADVPATYDLHKLQIAFEPVWTEALDDTLVMTAEAAYDRYVELGGRSSGRGGGRLLGHLRLPDGRQ